MCRPSPFDFTTSNPRLMNDPRSFLWSRNGAGLAKQVARRRCEMRWALFAAFLLSLCYAAGAQQQPDTTEPPLDYLRGPSFPASKHGPAWPKTYRPEAPAKNDSSPAESSTGTLQTESAAPKSPVTQEHAIRHKRKRVSHRHCRIHCRGGHRHSFTRVRNTEIAPLRPHTTEQKHCLLFDESPHLRVSDEICKDIAILVEFTLPGHPLGLNQQRMQ